MAQEEKFVYAFEEGRADMKYVLGGKGAHLAETRKTAILVSVRFFNARDDGYCSKPRSERQRAQTSP